MLEVHATHKHGELLTDIDGVFDSLRLIFLVDHGSVGFRRERDARVLRCWLLCCQPAIAALIPLEPRGVVHELVLERRRQHPRHVLVEPLLKHRPKHVLDAVFE